MGFINDQPIWTLGCLFKLSYEQHILYFILYTKHDNAYMLDALLWGWLKNVVCDDVISFHVASMMQLGMRSGDP